MPQAVAEPREGRRSYGECGAFVNATEAARVVGVSRYILGGMADRGEVRTARVGRRTVFHRGDCEGLAERLKG
jgi:hypothetical protein